MQMQVNIFFYNTIQMDKDQSLNQNKYVCGCGKTYSSYPAFSTHKRIKHANIHVEGTQLPRNFNPKRGRPSFTYPRHPTNSIYQQNAAKSYQSLTIIELGVLNLALSYPSIVADPQHQSKEDWLQYFQEQSSLLSTRQQDNPQVQIMKAFISLILIHLNPLIADAISRYLTQLTMWILKNTQRKEEEFRLDWEVKDNAKAGIDVQGIKEFYSLKENIELIQKIAAASRISYLLFVDVSVILSDWLCKMGYSSSTLKKITISPILTK